MNQHRTAGPDLGAPLPGTQFKRFLTLFHGVFLLGLLFSLVLRWKRDDFRWASNDTVLLGLVALQAALYVLFFVRVWKPPTALGWWLAYFGVSYVIWLAEWRIEPALQWTAWAYLGQMFGVLRPKVSVPIGIAVFLTYVSVATGWSRISFWEVIAGISLFTTVTGIGLFLHRLTVTSSERAELIQQLEAAQRQLERTREKDVELAALRERERLARDLHDSLGHGLVTLTVQLEAVQRLYVVDCVRASAMLDEMKELTRTSMDQLRRSLAGLRAPVLGDRPLQQALDALCRELERDGLKVDCQIAPGTERLAPAVRETLWRLAQEGLHNVHKHAHATTVKLRLALDPGAARIEVSDNGCGLPAGALDKPGHYGLRGLRERVEGLGGTFSVQSNGSGTFLQARIPFVG